MLSNLVVGKETELDRLHRFRHGLQTEKLIRPNQKIKLKKKKKKKKKTTSFIDSVRDLEAKNKHLLNSSQLGGIENRNENTEFEKNTNEKKEADREERDTSVAAMRRVRRDERERKR